MPLMMTVNSLLVSLNYLLNLIFLILIPVSSPFLINPKPVLQLTVATKRNKKTWKNRIILFGSYENVEKKEN
jgi:hypothetical protein